MNAYLLIPIVTGISTIILGGLVYLRNSKSVMSRYFLFVCLSTIVWIIANYFLDHGSSQDIKQLAARVSPAAAFNVLFWMYRFSSQFVNQSSTWNKPTWLLVWLLGTIFSSSSLVIESVSPGNNVTNIISGPGYIVHLVVITTLFCLTLWKLVTGRKSGGAAQKQQINYILLGIGTTISIGIINNGVMPVLHTDWQLVKFTPILALVFLGSISYAIVKHRLFDIRLVFARAIAYALLVSILLVFYTTIIFSASSLLFKNTVPWLQISIFAIASLFVAITFQPLKTALEKITDRVLFQSRYDMNTLLYDLTKVMATSQGINVLTQKTLEIILNRMHISRGGFFLVTTHGLVRPASQGIEIPDDDTLDLLRLLGNEKQFLILEEEQDEVIRQVMQKLNVSLVAALNVNQKLQGALLLGEKQSGQNYTNQDIQLLQILTPELAVALENALHFEQMSQFNQVLEHEVQQATQDLRIANDKLSQKNVELEQLDTLKDEFISVTSHELRTPLTAIRGYLWMIQHSKKGEEKFDTYMSRAYTSTERLLDIVNDTLDISRIESGRVQLSPAPTNIMDLADEVVSELLPKAKERGQSLSLARQSGLPAADCDPNKIHQVLTNIVGNALKFTPAKGKISISFRQDGSHIITSISDNGPGISPEDQAKLFQKFARLESTATIQGTGLGLYLCKQIVELSGGKIWIESQVGQGASFLFSLPTSSQQPSILPPRNHQFKSAITPPT